jgi:transmembrane sensor
VDHAGAMMEAAADWHLRLSLGLDAEQQARFDAWLAQSPAHGQAFAQIERAWQASGFLAQDPTIKALREKAMAPAPSRRPWWLAVAASVALLVAGGGAWWAIRPDADPVIEMGSGMGQTREFALADGSRVTLDAQSAVTARFGARSRVLELTKGRAFFAVAHDPARPFVVRAGSQAVVALGTHFDVRRDERGMSVALTEGRVRVGQAQGDCAALRPDSGAVGTELTAGQILFYDQASGVSRVMSGRAEQAAAWRSGRLHFDHTPLSGVVADFNRYGPAQIRLGDAGLGDLPVSGVFSASNQDGLLAALPALYPVRVERRGREIVLHRVK